MKNVRKGRSGRTLALLVGLLTLAAFGGAVGALAVPPVNAENFHPNKDQPGGAGGVITPLSDKPDGSTTSNATAHVTTVATIDTAAVEYFICPMAYAGMDPNVPASGCDQVGLDTTPTVPVSTGVPNVDEAYEAEIDLVEEGVRDFVAWVCTSATVRDTTNCIQEKEDDVTLEDASTGTAASQTSAGEITFPPHGSGVSNLGFTATASTSSDVASLCFQPDYDEGATTAPDNGSAATCSGGVVDSAPNNSDDDQTACKCRTWSAFINPTDDKEFGLQIIEQPTVAPPADSGQGACSDPATTQCQLDSHYLVSSAPVPTTAVVHFSSVTNSACVDDPATAPVIEAPDTAETNAPHVEETVEGCLFDQTGNLINDAAGIETAFQVTPVDAAAAAADPTGFDDPAQEGDENDTQADSFVEQVDLDGGADQAGADDRADQKVEFHRAGTYAITFCRDENNDAEDTASPQSATPCAGEAVAAAAMMTIVAGPTDANARHNHLLRSSDVAASPACHTGSSSFSAPAGSNVSLTGCLKDVYENPVPGAKTLWTAVVLGTAFFVGTPDQTTDPGGQADATVGSPTSAEGKNTTIAFCQDENVDGTCDQAPANVNITWSAAPKPPPGSCPEEGGYAKQKGSKGDDKLKGDEGCNKLIGKKGDDKLIGRGEDDLLIGGPDFDVCIGGPGEDIFKGCEKIKKGSQTEVT